MAGEHGAEYGKGIEEEGHEGLTPAPEEQAGEVHSVPGIEFSKQRQKGHGQDGQKEEAQPREIAGEEEPLPPEGQGVHQSGGTAEVEVGEHRHSGQYAEDKRDGKTQFDGIDHIAGGEIPRICRRRGPAVENTHREGQKPEGAIEGPDGPEAGEIFPKQRGAEPRVGAARPIRGRYRGPHSPHLPIHR